MTVHQLVVLVALLASVVLITQASARLLAAVALIASGIEALLAFRLISLEVSGINLGLILAIALVVSGVASWAREGGKSVVTAATAVSLIGAIQLAGILL
ncbi:MAG TPA: hypothetical protein VKZ63_22195 [Kofleriaceae bacterium]|nr:hypothetical protein [Kofleriaceae bacterium]